MKPSEKIAELQVAMSHLITGWNRLLDDVNALKERLALKENVIERHRQVVRSMAKTIGKKTLEIKELQGRIEVVENERDGYRVSAQQVTTMWAELKSENNLLRGEVALLKDALEEAQKDLTHCQEGLHVMMQANTPKFTLRGENND